MPRSKLLSRLRAPVTPVTLIEGPPGTGKSWLLRELSAGVPRHRGALPPEPVAGGRFLLDDADRLDGDELDRLISLVETASEPGSVLLAGRLFPDELLDAAAFAGSAVVGMDALRIEVDEITTEGPSDPALAASLGQLVERTDGIVRHLVTALQASGDHDRVVAVVNELVTAQARDVRRQLDDDQVGILSLMARTGALTRTQSDALAGRDSLDALARTGAPVFRRSTGGFSITTPWAYAGWPLRRSQVEALIGEIVDPLMSVELLIEAGGVDDAAGLLASVSESVTAAASARTVSTVLSRLGNRVDRSPTLLLLRSQANRGRGRLDEAHQDVARAADLLEEADGPLRRRIEIETARSHLESGRPDEAIAITDDVLRRLGAGEEHTFASAHEILAKLAATSDSRTSLQAAADHHATAAVAWDSCGEHVRARACRVEMVTSGLNPLGRFDEALAQLTALLDAPTLGDDERPWILLSEAFTLTTAGRLDAAQAKFEVTEAQAQARDNPRHLAASAWGRAMVAARRNDVDETERWIARAQNTALGANDSVFGIPFLCDVATALGGLDRLDAAEASLDQARQRADLFDDQIGAAAYILAARRGTVGDLDAQLERTIPAEWWRVLLVTADAVARHGDLDQARHLWERSQREAAALGLPPPAELGERATVERLTRRLTGAAAAPAPDAPASDQPPSERPAGATGRPGVRVLATTCTVTTGGRVVEVPAGNPRRLIGIIVGSGGTATLDQVNEAIWPDDEPGVSRNRLRNVLMRVRQAVGDIVVRTSAGFRLSAHVDCDLLEFEALTRDAAAAARMDPELAGRLAEQAIALVGAVPFQEFEYEEWAVAIRQRVERRLIDALDLRSIQAEDDGNLPLAQSYAERALHYDRYDDSRYVRVAELMVLQGRNAAARAMLEAATTAARTDLARPGERQRERNDR